jgi:hypothetical protein
MKFLNSKHTLFDVISQLFTHDLNHKLELKANMLDEFFKRKVNDLHFYGPIETQHPFTIISNYSSCTAATPVMLNTINVKPRDCFLFVYNMHGYGPGGSKIEFYVTSVSTPTAEDLMMTDPVVIPDTRVFDPNAAQLYKDEELAESRRYRNEYENTKKYRWKSVYHYRVIDHELVKAAPPEYSLEEKLVMRTLILRGNMKFAEAWRKYLEPALLDHTKSGVSRKLVCSKITNIIQPIELHSSLDIYNLMQSETDIRPLQSLEEAWKMLLGIRQLNLDIPVMPIPPKPKSFRERFFEENEPDYEIDIDKRLNKRLRGS